MMNISNLSFSNLEENTKMSLKTSKKQYSKTTQIINTDNSVKQKDLRDQLDLSDFLNDEEEQELITKSLYNHDVESPHKEHLDVLQRCFGHKSFRPMQWKIINSIINNKRDNCAIMATGYGKSLCYQYPSVFCGGLTIVISPLISLMEDQVLSLELSNISACLLGSAQTQQKKVIEEILNNKYSLVYLTPEFCCGDYGKELLKKIDSKLSIVMIAIDEAHCVSTWGHDFRFHYRQLGILKTILPNVPMLAVTATATQRVRNDIVKTLKLRNPQVLCSGFDRPNLYFSVFLKGNQGINADLKKVMIKQNNTYVFSGSTIIYCITRKKTEELADMLKVKGLKCLPYHAGLTMKQRKEAHEKFVRDKIDVIVATIAFGMGIDKPDVRNVIHYGCSRDIESYYQEVGRAGRDGQPAKCITFYNTADFDLHRTLRDMSYGNKHSNAQTDSLSKIMEKYLEGHGCRRKFILEHFEGPKYNDNIKPNCCDNCTKKLEQKVPEIYEGVDTNGLYDFTEDAHLFLAAVNAMKGKFGTGLYILFLRGSKTSKLSDSFQRHPLHGSGKHKTEDWWKCIERILEREKYLTKTTKKSSSNYTYHIVNVSQKGDNFLNNVSNKSTAKILIEPTPDIFKLLKRKTPIVCPVPEIPTFIAKTPSRTTSSFLPKKSFTQTSEAEVVETNEQKEERMMIYRLLLNKRNDVAHSLDCMPYMVASNEALMKMAQFKPKSITELRNCQLDGFTEAKITKFGETFMEIIPANPVLSVETPRKTISEILSANPIPDVKLSNTARCTYNLYKNGLTVQNIANERKLQPSTINTHLCECIEVGKPVKLKDLTVTEKIKNKVIDVITSSPLNTNMSLTSIKAVCPEITFEQIKAVLSYQKVRNHLKQINCEYIDFEIESKDLNYDKTETEENDALNALVDVIEKQIYLDETAINESVCFENQSIGPPEKKQKLDDLTLLDEVFG